MIPVDRSAWAGAAATLLCLLAATLLCVFTCLGTAHGLPPDLWDGLWEAPQPAALLGHGGLTVSLDAEGAVLGLRWPGPGGLNQFRPPVTGPWTGDVNDGPSRVGWVVEADGARTWLGEAPWPLVSASLEDGVLVREFEHEETGATATETLFVHPAAQVFALRLTLDDFSMAGRVFFHAVPAPATVPVPELPVLNAAAPAKRGFAGAALEDGLYVFRPETPGVRERQRLVLLEDAPPDYAEWRRFGDGAWMRFEAYPPPVGRRFGDGDESAREAIAAGTVDGPPMTATPVDLGLAFSGESAAAAGGAHVYITVDGSLNRAADPLPPATALTFDTLHGETTDFWAERRDALALPGNAPEELQAAASRAARILTALTCAETGAVVEGVADAPPQYTAAAADAPWIAAALRAVGAWREAYRHLRFLAEHVNMQEAPGRPAGTIPHRLYVTGEPAGPVGAVNLEATAALLQALEEHAQATGGEDGPAFAAETWSAAAAMGGLLTGWADTRTWRPRHSYAPELGRDRYTPDLAPTVYRGVTAAIALAGAAGESTGEGWRTRTDELEAVLRFECLDEDGEWTVDAPLRHWDSGAVPRDNEQWTAITEAALEGIGALPPRERALVLAQAAGVAQVHEEVRDAVEAALLAHGPGLIPGADLEGGGVDINGVGVCARTAALVCLAVHRLYGG